MPAEPYAHLSVSILDSSVWAEPSDVRVVWITLIAMADRTGYVGASIDGIAYRARVPEDVVADALARFEAPDKKSRSQEHEGRRIKRVARGWVLLNYEEIRNAWRLDRVREQKRRWWRENRGSSSSSSRASSSNSSYEDEGEDASRRGSGGGVDTGRYPTFVPEPSLPESERVSPKEIQKLARAVGRKLKK